MSHNTDEAGANRAHSKRFYHCVVESIDAVLDLCDRYAQAAADLGGVGQPELAERLHRVPRTGAKNFLEALQMFRILHFTLWCEGEYHNTIGRFDQFMFPYLARDLETGALTREAAYDLLLEFFITFNKDSDLYPGVQQGDNGQSLMLGGLTPDGTDGFNELSEMCLRASKELKLIDPKINLRVHRDTPLSVYELGTELTREGLGFPQYANDDVVIPGLMEKGYAERDARNYTVAACWEFIIPKHGMDIPNIDALSFPAVVDAVLDHAAETADFDTLKIKVDEEIRRRCRAMVERHKNLYIIPAPFMSVLMSDCLERGSDISEGARYNNYGIHGTGLSTAADSLAAIRKLVWEEKSITLPEFVAHVRNNFQGQETLLSRLRNEMPKMGQDDDNVDDIAAFLLNSFAATLEGGCTPSIHSIPTIPSPPSKSVNCENIGSPLKNERGGIYRAGTGSAMFYLWHADELGASPDGRLEKEAFGANYAPSLFAKTTGPISVIQSFTKPCLRSVINGGPLTMEFHDTLFRDPESVRKVALLVKSFVDLGGHQIQLNAINRDTLLHAQQHPEQYPNLIVRIWGWSAYFVELDKCYQDHVLQRQEYV